MGTVSVCVLLVAAFTLGRKHWADAMETMWPAKPEMFTVGPLQEECADPWNRWMTRLPGTAAEPRELPYFSLPQRHQDVKLQGLTVEYQTGAPVFHKDLNLTRTPSLLVA